MACCRMRRRPFLVAVITEIPRLAENEPDLQATAFDPDTQFPLNPISYHHD